MLKGSAISIERIWYPSYTRTQTSLSSTLQMTIYIGCPFPNVWWKVNSHMLELLHLYLYALWTPPKYIYSMIMDSCTASIDFSIIWKCPDMILEHDPNQSNCVCAVSITESSSSDWPDFIFLDTAVMFVSYSKRVANKVLRPRFS